MYLAGAVPERWLLLTASRSWSDRDRMWSTFLAMQRRFPGTRLGLVHGGAKGGGGSRCVPRPPHRSRLDTKNGPTEAWTVR